MSQLHSVGLDYVRCAAITWVVLRHGWVAIDETGSASSALETFAANGWLGVDLFFALSGFLIARSYLEKSSAKAFLVHRAARIVPAYFALLGLIAVAPALFIPEPQLFSALELGEHLVFFNDYFGSDLIVAFWSLAVEAKFYLFAAAVFFLLRGHHPRHVAFVFLGCAFAAFAYKAIAVAAGPQVETYSAYFRLYRSPAHFSLEALLLGASLGAFSTYRVFGRFSRWALTLVGGTLLLALGTTGQWLIDPSKTQVVVVPAIAAVAAVILVVGAFSWSTRNEHRMVKTGAAMAFTLYLVHMSTIPASTFFFHRFESILAFWVVYLLASLGAAYVLHIVIEKPAFRWLVLRFGGRPATPAWRSA